MASYIKVDPSDPRYNPFGGGMVQVPDGTPGAVTVDPNAQSYVGLTPDKQGNLVGPDGKIVKTFADINLGVRTGTIDPKQLPAGAGSGWGPDPSKWTYQPGTQNGPNSLVPDGNGNYTYSQDVIKNLPPQYQGQQMIIKSDGSVVHPDGTPVTDANGNPQTDATVKAYTSNPTNKPTANVATDILNTLQDSITKGNPNITGAKALYDIATGHGKKAVGDELSATTFGGVGTDDNGNITAGPVTKDVTKTAQDSGVTLPGLPNIDLGGIGSGDRTVDPGAQNEVDRANSLADALDVDRQHARDQANTDRGNNTQTREQQEAMLQMLKDAAEGKAPSAAELALTRQSGIDASRQYGLAAALQGNNPSAALRQASMGAAKVAGDTAANAAQLRANEQATYRKALADALAGVRGQDINNVNTDVSEESNDTSGETTSQGQGVTAEGNILSRQSAKDQADATKEGAIISGVGGGLTTLLTKSDKRVKKDVKQKSLADELAKGVHGVVFKYEAPEEDDGKHFGVLAQQIREVVPGAVKKMPDGALGVDAGHMTMANTAILSELARRIMELEKKGGKR